MEPLVALLRRYVVDYTNRHDTSICAQLMEPDYTLRMGPHVVAGRDEAYVPAAQAQFAQFPGLGLTVHEMVTNGDRLAMRFSEHGASVRHGGAVAVWGGLGLYAWNGRRLVSNWVEQDYLARRRQLASRVPSAVEPPAPAPWDTVAQPRDPAAETAVRAWLAAGRPGADVRVDDGTSGVRLVDVERRIDDLFSAGDRVAFRITEIGRYRGGVAEMESADAPATLHLVGLVTVAGGRVTAGRLVSDRLGLLRSLTAGAPA